MRGGFRVRRPSWQLAEKAVGAEGGGEACGRVGVVVPSLASRRSPLSPSSPAHTRSPHIDTNAYALVPTSGGWGREATSCEPPALAFPLFPLSPSLYLPFPLTGATDSSRHHSALPPHHRRRHPWGAPTAAPRRRPPSAVATRGAPARRPAPAWAGAVAISAAGVTAAAAAAAGGAGAPGEGVSATTRTRARSGRAERRACRALVVGGLI